MFLEILFVLTPNIFELWIQNGFITKGRVKKSKGKSHYGGWMELELDLYSIIATLGSILDSQLSCESGKF